FNLGAGRSGECDPETEAKRKRKESSIGHATSPLHISGNGPGRRTRPVFLARLKRYPGKKSLLRFTTGSRPRPRAGSFLPEQKPILPRHLAAAGEAKPQQRESDRDEAVHCIIILRQQGAAKQGSVEEALGAAEDQHVEHELPPRPPGLCD